METDPLNDPYKPLTGKRAEQLHDWHENAYQSDAREEDKTYELLGLKLVVPPDVHPPNPMSDLLGNAILGEVKESDRVLDMGTGSGINALIAASKSHDITAVDINPNSVDCAKENAKTNELSDRITFLQSDVFSHVNGLFDLIIFDPPFRWFSPRDIRERGMADENYESLRTFFREVTNYLTEQGRLLMLFGTSGDIEYFYSLARAAGFKSQVVNTRSLQKDDQLVDYFAFKLTR